MTRDQALPYVSLLIDDALAVRSMVHPSDVPTHARLVGWQCGFEPMFVAVFSYLPGVKLDDADAEDIARDYLLERNWFADNNATDADYII